MANNIPDYMRDFDLNQDYGFTPVTKKPEDESKPSVDPKLVEGQSLELSKVKSDVKDIKSMMNEIFEIVNEKESISKEVASADVQKRFKELEKVILPFLYNLSKSDEPYIHWPNRGPIIKGQIERILKLTRG
jgi:vacuolar-type H+-ATPase subunit I/STV1|tara:strand:+ start:5535 stop:5930 length:396 start_codon:yes stop_codon:yes gene_type:complete